MRSTLYKRTVVGSILAALAAGMFPMGAGATQSSAHKKTTKSSTASSHATAGNSSKTSGNTSAKATATGTTAHKTSGKKSSRKATKKVKGQTAPTPERINEIQSALAKNGSYNGVPSGTWDDSTVEAMKNFQASHGLNPSGKLDAPTLQKLGLGSETAGVAAPTPPNGTANRLLSSRSQQDHPDNQPDHPDK
jgi:peptidoglycan hydrolase-like protein with peptidoglycan-binding domain